jgi:class 3 adenylate cyclase
LSDADIFGLAQAYARGIARIVAAESHVTARALATVPERERAGWLERWQAALVPLATPTFEILHAEQLATAVHTLLGASGDPRPAELAVSFVDLRGSTEFMLRSSHEEIRSLVDGVFVASREVSRTYNVTVAKHMGDGALLVGADRGETLAAVVALIGELARRTPLRAAAGVDFGTVTTRAGDHFGPPVNFASRLSEVAPVGGVLLGPGAVPDPEPEGEWYMQAVRGLPELRRVFRLHLR